MICLFHHKADDDACLGGRNDAGLSTHGVEQRATAKILSRKWQDFWFITDFRAKMARNKCHSEGGACADCGNPFLQQSVKETTRERIAARHKGARNDNQRYVSFSCTEIREETDFCCVFKF